MPEVIVFLNNPNRLLNLAPEILCSTYGLIPAEVRLAIAATAVGSLKDVAKNVGVAASTARTQLKQIYAKPGTGSRADLVRLVIGSSATR